LRAKFRQDCDWNGRASDGWYSIAPFNDGPMSAYVLFEEELCFLSAGVGGEILQGVCARTGSLTGRTGCGPVLRQDKALKYL
jgi:hypothetical protein